MNATYGVRGKSTSPSPIFFRGPGSMNLRKLVLGPGTDSIDALEQIDVSLNLIEKYSDDFQMCRTADDVEHAIQSGKIASLFGLEG